MTWLVTQQAIPMKSGVILMARILGYRGELVNQASFSAVAWVLQDLTTNTLVNTGTLVVSDVIFNVTQYDLQWTKDSPSRPANPPPDGDGYYGYNFKTILTAANFLTADR